jgi:hypothetical protein
MRYDTVPYSDGLAIHDSVLNQFIKDGKENVLVLPTLGQAVKVISDLRERVGA